MPAKLPGVPTTIAATLDRLCEELALSAKENFVGLILYGGLARGRYRQGKSDVNVIVLCNDVSGAALQALTPALRKAWREAAVDPFILSVAELPHVAEVFPTKFLDIKNHHVVLIGPDPFIGLEVPRELIRIRCEQELRNQLLRLRHTFIVSGGDELVLCRTLSRLARPLAIELQALLQAAGKPLPTEDRTAAVYAAAAAGFGLPHEPLAKLAEFRQHTKPSNDLTDLYRGVLAAVAQAAECARQLKGTPNESA